MSYDNDYDDYLDGDYYDDYDDYDDGCNDHSNSAESYGEESNMSAQVGAQFKTGNSTVANLAEGTVLRVAGPGTLEIVEVPVAEFEAGDRIQTHHGPSTVVRLSSRLGELEGFDPETQILYVSDDSTVVRRINKDSVSAL